MADKLWHLKNCELFQKLSPEETAFIERNSFTLTYPARSSIYLPNDSADAVFLVAEGVVKVSRLSPDGKESILTFIDEGEVFGELALIDLGCREELVEAVSCTTVVMIPAEIVQRVVAQRSDLALAVTKLVGLRRQRIERRLKNLLFQSCRERLIHLLLDLEEQFGHETAEGVQLRLRLSHQDMANLIGTTRETVTGILGDLRNEKLVQCQRCKVLLAQPVRLAKCVNRIRSSKPPTSAPISLTRSAWATS